MKNKAINGFLTGFILVLSINSTCYMKETEKLNKKINKLEEINFNLEQNNIDLKWQLGEMASACQGGKGNE